MNGRTGTDPEDRSTSPVRFSSFNVVEVAGNSSPVLVVLRVFHSPGPSLKRTMRVDEHSASEERHAGVLERLGA